MSTCIHTRRSFLKKADSTLADRIRKKLRKLQNKPFRLLEHFADQEVHKLRIGDYRALIEVQHEHQRLLVRYIDHRKRIYKRFDQ